MKLINADLMISTQVYEDEHEEWIDKKMSISDFLDSYTDEGCPKEELSPCQFCKFYDEHDDKDAGFCCGPIQDWVGKDFFCKRWKEKSYFEYTEDRSEP